MESPAIVGTELNPSIRFVEPSATGTSQESPMQLVMFPDIPSPQDAEPMSSTALPLKSCMSGIPSPVAKNLHIDESLNKTREYGKYPFEKDPNSYFFRAGRRPSRIKPRSSQFTDLTRQSPTNSCYLQAAVIMLLVSAIIIAADFDNYTES